MRNEKHKTFLFKFLLIVSLALVSGCSFGTETKDTNTSTLEIVLGHLFNGPHDELIELVNDPANQTIIGIGEEDKKEQNSDGASELDDYLQDLYGTYFTNNAYERFYGIYPLEYQLHAYENKHKMSVDTIDVEESDAKNKRYDFTVLVTIIDKSEDEANFKKMEVEGYANFSQEGKITRFNILDDDGLRINDR